MSLELRFLPAREGDAIWVRWGDGDGLDRQLLVDMGTRATGLALRSRLEALPVSRRALDLLVVTHVDSDHIGGVLSGLAEATQELEGLRFGDIWFNGWTHLHGRRVPGPRESAGRDAALEPMGGVQGEQLSSWLGTPWNEAFGRGPVVRDGAPPRIELAGGLALTVLGPQPHRLEELQPTWENEVHEAVEKGKLTAVSPGLERMGALPTRPELRTAADLDELADTWADADPSRANGSSIVLLLEWGGERRVLLTGDAYGDDVADGLEALHQPLPVAVDVVKLPHHGARSNVTERLVRSVSCPTWVFSTDGTRFHHPHADAVARVIRSAVVRPPSVRFNVPSTYNGWWDDDGWKARFGYEAEYGDAADGITVRFGPRSDP